MSNPSPPPFTAGWNRVATHYTTHLAPRTISHARDLLSASLPAIQPASLILDICCGPGVIALAYLDLFPHGIKHQKLICLDVSPVMVATAESAVGERVGAACETQFQFLVGDATAIQEVGDGSVDVVLSCFGVAVMPRREEALREVRRVLKVGGVFGSAAWVGLPEGCGGALEEAGYGLLFQELLPRAYASVLPDIQGDWPEEKQPWVVWASAEKARGVLKEAGFESVVVHRSVHTNVFADVQELVGLIWNSCAFIDMALLGEQKKGELTDFLKKQFDGQDGETLFMLFSANLILCTRKAD
eukprot:GFKZ01005711.1.p1 GENE.GFKZ01005711.1~~GFKZ01005711.1.p1  ORF type:complete len:320 (-),score=51.12 GFKZ01005711.1:496-1398(-)